MTHTVTILAWKPVSVNVLLRLHWSQRPKLLRFDQDVVAAEMLRCAVPKATGKRRLSVRVLVRGKGRLPDADNALKSLCDALVACGQLVDDSPAWLELGVIEVARSDEAKTVITLEDVPR